jgi:hypothetical protein
VPASCSICSRGKRAAVDADLAAGRSLRTIAGTHGLSKDAVARHRDGCLTTDVRTALEAEHSEREQGESADRGATVLRQIEGLLTETRGILADAKEEGKGSVALGAVGRALECLTLIAKLTGELDERPRVQVLVTSPEWVELRGLILAALRPYPDALAALAAALEGGPDGGLPAVA